MRRHESRRRLSCRGALSAHRVLLCPAAGCRLILRPVRLVHVGNLGDKRVIRVGVSQQGADGEQDLEHSNTLISNRPDRHSILILFQGYNEHNATIKHLNYQHNLIVQLNGIIQKRLILSEKSSSDFCVNSWHTASSQHNRKVLNEWNKLKRG